MKVKCPQENESNEQNHANTLVYINTYIKCLSYIMLKCPIQEMKMPTERIETACRMPTLNKWRIRVGRGSLLCCSSQREEIEMLGIIATVMKDMLVSTIEREVSFSQKRTPKKTHRYISSLGHNGKRRHVKMWRMTWQQSTYNREKHEHASQLE